MTSNLLNIEIAEAPALIDKFLTENQQRCQRLGETLRSFDPKFYVTIARGSSDFACTYFKYLIEQYTGRPCASVGPSLSSIYHSKLKLDSGAALTITQSGKSPDVIALLTQTRQQNCISIECVNDVDSPVAKIAQNLIPLCAGREKSVAATKSFIASMLAGAVITSEVAQLSDLKLALTRLTKLAFKNQNKAALNETLSKSASALILARGPSLAIAQELALKLKETCAIHAEAFSLAEVFHGPAEILTKDIPAIVLLPRDQAYENSLQQIERLRKMGIKLCVIDIAEIESNYAEIHPVLHPLALIYHCYGELSEIAQAHGRDANFPKLLNKVTETI